jgi:hypothetical protein
MCRAYGVIPPHWVLPIRSGAATSISIQHHRFLTRSSSLRKCHASWRKYFLLIGMTVGMMTGSQFRQVLADSLGIRIVMVTVGVVFAVVQDVGFLVHYRRVMRRWWATGGEIP